MRISVIGAGYLGTVQAVCLADAGHEVVALDVDPGRVEALSRGVAPFHEPELAEMLARVVPSGALTATTDPTALAGIRLHFLTVGTPQSATGYAADLRGLHAAVATVAEHGTGGTDCDPVLVVGKCTVPVGTAAGIAAQMSGAARNAVLVWNPEFLREGHAVADTLRPDRIVYGLPPDRAVAHRAVKVLDELLAETAGDAPRLLVDYATAEMAKVAANSFLATKISFINAMADLCEATGADVVRLAEAIGLDDRIGPAHLRAGIGFGGGCLTKDIRAFMARAGEVGAAESLAFLREVDSVNLRRRERAVAAAVELLGGSPLGRQVAVLGLAFKPDSDDTRDSPALDIAGRLAGLGARIVATDPVAGPKVRARRPDLVVVDRVEDAVSGADLVMVLTDWPAYRDLVPSDVGSLVRARVIFDGRNVLDPTTWRAAGWTYRGVGRATPP